MQNINQLYRRHYIEANTILCRSLVTKEIGDWIESSNNDVLYLIYPPGSGGFSFLYETLLYFQLNPVVIDLLDKPALNKIEQSKIKSTTTNKNKKKCLIYKNGCSSFLKNRSSYKQMTFILVHNYLSTEIPNDVKQIYLSSISQLQLKELFSIYTGVHGDNRLLSIFSYLEKNRGGNIHEFMRLVFLYRTNLSKYHQYIDSFYEDTIIDSHLGNTGLWEIEKLDNYFWGIKKEQTLYEITHLYKQNSFFMPTIQTMYEIIPFLWTDVWQIILPIYSEMMVLFYDSNITVERLFWIIAKKYNEMPQCAKKKLSNLQLSIYTHPQSLHKYFLNREEHSITEPMAYVSEITLEMRKSLICFLSNNMKMSSVEMEIFFSILYNQYGPKYRDNTVHAKELCNHLFHRNEDWVVLLFKRILALYCL